MTTAPSTADVLFTVDALAEPGMLPCLLQPFAKRDLTPDHMLARREGDLLRVELGMAAMPAEMVHLVAGNLGQVIGVLRVTETRREALREAA
ncbi:hypothetical protein [Sediminicoccus rosea]|uniref:Uncharacterized protein n=1 Tax=Sediminicoccus rosea TaxID=1225128 RepID=A0ABZ0PHK5_9PROT|nr:hypothetical protein [Sediminicoccus rosea]WPB85115.1 hypothetical protein R9Z33_23875 [Sediminicoccus rosea]